jgi:hypothetical protein
MTINGIVFTGSQIRISYEMAKFSRVLFDL